MKNTSTFFGHSTSRFKLILLGATILLTIPFLLQLTIGTGIDGQGFNWKPDDFIIFGILLFGTGIVYELILRKIKSKKQRLLLCGAVLCLILLVWIDLALGIFDIPGFSGH